MIKCDLCKFSESCDQHHWDCRYNPVTDTKKNIRKKTKQRRIKGTINEKRADAIYRIKRKHAGCEYY